MIRWLPLLLLAACSTRAAASARVVVSPEVAADAVQALGLWTEATGGEFAPEVAVSDSCADADWCITQVDRMTTSDCPDSTVPNLADRAAPRACNWREPGGLNWIVLNSSGTRPEERVGTIAHEAGHRLGLAHLPGTGDLMDPDRPAAVRAAPCVSADDVAEAGFSGPGTCLGAP